MNFYFKYDYTCENQIDLGGADLVELIEQALDGADYDNGELETIRDTGQNIKEFLGRLLLVLIEKEIITKAELKKMLDPSILGYDENGKHIWPKRSKKEIK